MPERVGAAATFHGGGLVTDKPDSPHLLIPKMKAHFLIAIAANDDAEAAGAKKTLAAAFAAAHLPAEIEVYRGHDARLVSAGLPRLQPRRGREGLGAPAGAVQERARLSRQGRGPPLA